MSQKSLKLISAFVILGIAGLIAGYQFFSNRDQATVEADATVKVTCSQCNQTFDMPFSDYQRLSPKGTDVGGAIVCPKCGAKALTRGFKSSEPTEEPEAPPTYEEKPPAAAGD